MAEEDLIFGKNRHFFGGIEPSNMKEFSVAEVNGSVLITAILPDDTIVNEQTLCSVSGAVIRRKANGFPKDEFDGDLVLNATESLTFIDSEADSDGVYYYAAFPYTSQGVYNRNTINRASLNMEPMDLRSEAIFIPLSVKLYYTIPDGYTGVVIRKGTTSYPETETDGEAVGTFTTSETFTDTDVEQGLTYLYSFFLYDDSGNYLMTETVLVHKRQRETIYSDMILF